MSWDDYSKNSIYTWIISSFGKSRSRRPIYNPTSRIVIAEGTIQDIMHREHRELHREQLYMYLPLHQLPKKRIEDEMKANQSRYWKLSVYDIFLALHESLILVSLILVNTCVFREWVCGDRWVYRYVYMFISTLNLLLQYYRLSFVTLCIPIIEAHLVLEVINSKIAVNIIYVII